MINEGLKIEEEFYPMIEGEGLDNDCEKYMNDYLKCIKCIVFNVNA